MALEQRAALLEEPQQVRRRVSRSMLGHEARHPSPRCRGVRGPADILPRVTPISAVLIAQNEEKTIADALRERGLLRRDRARGLGLDRPDPRDRGGGGGPGGRQRALARLRGPARLRGAGGAPRLGARPRRRRAGGRRAARGDRGAARRRASTAAGYRIPRVAFYLGRWIRGTDWYPDWQVRFFDRTRAAWQGDLVHESVRVRRAGGAAPRRARAPPLRRHLRPPAQDRLLHDAVGPPGPRRGAAVEHRST